MENPVSQTTGGEHMENGVRGGGGLLLSTAAKTPTRTELDVDTRGMQTWQCNPKNRISVIHVFFSQCVDYGGMENTSLRTLSLVSYVQ
ncbi:unnamed protein product [Boreogadus saida]